jgi:hypothetical protein
VRLRESHSEGGGEGDPEATPRGDQRGGTGDERAEATRREREAAATCEGGQATGVRVLPRILPLFSARASEDENEGVMRERRRSSSGWTARGDPGEE